MLTLAHGCSCDVCAEEYGPHRLPHSIPCGHVLCASCCTNIVEKTSSRHPPSCPFCREHFSSDQIRMIRMDFTTSGWSTPRRFPTIETNYGINSEVLARRTERLLSTTDGLSRTRLEARRLEDKVAKVAAKKCSVEEVSALHKELEDWLLAEKDDQTSSLYLSAALLRAILVNHMAHAEASKSAKEKESSYKKQIAELEHSNERLDSELRRQRLQYTQKSQECQLLRAEISQLKSLATTLGASPTRFPQSTPIVEEPPSPPTSPSPYSPAQTPISRFHSRSASMSSRPTTPAATPMMPSRSHTPAVAPSPPRSHTPSLRASSQTPTPSMRSYTPGPNVPPVPSIPTRYAATPTPTRSYTPAPLVPPKPRRLSQSSPPKMARSMSEEKAEAHERWLPPELANDPSKLQRGFSSSAYAASRLRDLNLGTKSPAPY
ncbi:hypothetical protein CC2G_003284 [Coprinopsis cinerea AmutBmut pab1-1]|nr:hypothetical protein CC2G_003284 [Coprinopsis cinerea AmutBmut pab1-1]KAG2004760.1 hypothetical protein CC2G_003284 [Coprinopsis cinerea AmutBmut pab1-1]